MCGSMNSRHCYLAQVWAIVEGAAKINLPQNVVVLNRFVLQANNIHIPCKCETPRVLFIVSDLCHIYVDMLVYYNIRYFIELKQHCPEKYRMFAPQNL